MLGCRGTTILKRARAGLPVEKKMERMASLLKAGCVQEFLQKHSAHPSTGLAFSDAFKQPMKEVA